jgi:hypothetical protein
MRQRIADAIAEFIGNKLGVEARYVSAADGGGELQWRQGRHLVRFELHGRPDGVQPRGHGSTLEQLSAAAAQPGDSGAGIRPQDWMELDREFALYQQRRQAALVVALAAYRQERPADAIRLARISRRDAFHQLATIDLAEQHHPAGHLSDAGPAQRAVLHAQSAVAEAVTRLAEGDATGALRQLREGAAQANATRHALGRFTAEENAAGGALSLLIERMESLVEGATPVTSVDLSS